MMCAPNPTYPRRRRASITMTSPLRVKSPMMEFPNRINFLESVSTPPLQSTKKSVSFEKVVMIYPVMHHKDYTDRERNLCWQTQFDKQRMKAGLLRTIRNAGSNPETKSHHRGLERLLDGGATCERRRYSVKAVLNAQTALRQKHPNTSVRRFGLPCILDQTELRIAYAPHSQSAAKQARTRATIDAMAIAYYTALVQSPKKAAPKRSASSPTSRRLPLKPTLVSPVTVRCVH